ncbi:hypothetical protein PMAYCL1PPCAC_26129, partial [Pristionchus mayeri]
MILQKRTIFYSHPEGYQERSGRPSDPEPLPIDGIHERNETESIESDSQAVHCHSDLLLVEIRRERRNLISGGEVGEDAVLRSHLLCDLNCLAHSRVLLAVGFFLKSILESCLV